MHYVIFDIDGTLTQSTEFDSLCFKSAVLEHVDVVFKDDWGEYKHVTDSGILNEIIDSHGFQEHECELTSKIKSTFISNIENHLKCNPVEQVPGANNFLAKLTEIQDVSVAIATGCWGETAELKLKSAGIDYQNFPLCSANDGLSRIDIMKSARAKAGNKTEQSISYFGDASWDKSACEELGWNFILVGNQTSHFQRIDTFNQLDQALRFCIL